MSVKAAIQSVKVTGVPVYLGRRSGTDSFSANPDTVMNWMADGWRTRFNHQRSKRQRWCKVTFPDGETKRTLVPIGSTVTDLSNKDSRQLTYLSSIPDMILSSTERVENTEWFAATKRRKTLRAKGKNQGSMPGFRSAKRQPQFFVCWFNGGRNANFVRTGKRTGVVTITGRNSIAHPKHKGKSWSVAIRIRTRQEVPVYTSVVVNWTDRTLVFTAAPSKTPNPDATPEILGIDRGKLVALSTGELSTVPQQVADYNKQGRRIQRKMGKMRSRADKAGRDGKRLAKTSRRYRELKTVYGEVCRKETAVRNDWLHRLTTRIAENHSVVALENLHIESMTRRAKGKGSSRKKTMNRVFRNAAPSTFESMLSYKLDGLIVKVPPAYTSQRCFACGYTSKENRESQAVFVCKNCNHKDNADLNAAKNIKLVASLTGVVDTASTDGGVVVSPKLSTETFAYLYRKQTADCVCTRQTPSSVVVQS